MTDRTPEDPWAADAADHVNSDLSDGQRVIIRQLLEEYLDGQLTLGELLDGVDGVRQAGRRDELPF